MSSILALQQLTELNEFTPIKISEYRDQGQCWVGSYYALARWSKLVVPGVLYCRDEINDRGSNSSTKISAITLRNSDCQTKDSFYQFTVELDQTGIERTYSYSDRD